MKLTENKLKKLIADELQRYLKEASVGGQPPAAGGWRSGTGSSSGGDVETREIFKAYGTLGNLKVVEIEKHDYAKYQFGLDGVVTEPVAVSPEGMDEIAYVLEQAFTRQQSVDSDMVVGQQVDRSRATVEFRGVEINDEYSSVEYRLEFKGHGAGKGSYIKSNSAIWTINVKEKYVQELIDTLKNLY